MIESIRTPERLRVVFALSWLIVMLAALAAAVGLPLPCVYGETAWVVPQNRGQRRGTLLALAVMAPVQVVAQRGSPRATLIWLGRLGSPSGISGCHRYISIDPERRMSSKLHAWFDSAERID